MGQGNKKLAIMLSLLVFGGSFLPIQSASAFEILGITIPDITNVITDGAVKTFTMGIIFAITGGLGALSPFILKLGQDVLAWVMSSDFIAMSMTGQDNPIVSYGWPMMRDLANIILLLSLIVIGLGIILGIEEYRVKKTLPKLIAIALLINFTPVICGFIIDFTNLLMNYFLGAGTVTQGLYDTVFSGSQVKAGGDIFSNLASTLVYCIFGWIGGIVYFLYAALFIARYIFLWILVIFAPIAFVSNVFPPVKNLQSFFPSFFHWDEWWKQFIQWSVIGIYAAFFISLANQLMVKLGNGTLSVATPTGTLFSFGPLFVYLFPLALLIVGFYAVLETGSTAGIPGWKKMEDKLKGAAWGIAGGAVGAVAGAATGSLVGAGTGIKEGKGIKGKLSSALIGAAEGGFTAEGHEAGRRWAMKGLETVRLAKPGEYEAGLKKQTSEEEKRLENLSNERLNSLAVDPLAVTREGKIRKAAALNILAKRGSLNLKNMEDLEESNNFGLNKKEVLKHMPMVAERLGEKTNDVVAGMTPADFVKNVQKESLQDPNVFFATNYKQLVELGLKGSTDKKETLKKYIITNKSAIQKYERELNMQKLGKSKAEIAEIQAKIDELRKKVGHVTNFKI